MGINAFIRSRPPLNLSHKSGMAASRRTVIALFRICVCVSVLSLVGYFSTFSGFAAPGAWIGLYVIAGFLAFLYADLSFPELPRVSRRRWPFLPGVPTWVRAASVAAFLFVVAQLVDAGVRHDFGVPERIDGQTVLVEHGIVLHSLSDAEDSDAKEAQARLLISFGMMLWINASLLWWVHRRELSSPQDD